MSTTARGRHRPDRVLRSSRGGGSSWAPAASEDPAASSGGGGSSSFSIAIGVDPDTFDPAGQTTTTVQNIVDYSVETW